MLAAVQKALVELQIPNHNVVTISGIGCSSNFPGFINTYGMHTLHGRALAVATGLKLANHELTVLVTGGDGDGFGIGGNHFVHSMRRNVDLLYIVMDNEINGLTWFNAAAGVPFVATLSQSQSQSPESASQAKPAHFRPNLHSRRAKESQSGALRSLSARAQSPSSSAPEPGTGPSWLARKSRLSTLACR